MEASTRLPRMRRRFIKSWRIEVVNLSIDDPLSQKALLFLSLNRTSGQRFAHAHQRFMTDMNRLSLCRGRGRVDFRAGSATPRKCVAQGKDEFPAKYLYPSKL